MLVACFTRAHVRFEMWKDCATNISSICSKNSKTVLKLLLSVSSSFILWNVLFCKFLCSVIWKFLARKQLEVLFCNVSFVYCDSRFVTLLNIGCLKMKMTFDKTVSKATKKLSFDWKELSCHKIWLLQTEVEFKWTQNARRQQPITGQRFLPPPPNFSYFFSWWRLWAFCVHFRITSSQKTPLVLQLFNKFCMGRNENKSLEK